jgi:hypothetical protein
MRKENLYKIIGVGAAVGLAILIVTWKKDDDDDSKDEPDPQTKPDLKLDVRIREGNTKGLIVKSKVDKAKLRTSNLVNDGTINNLYGEIPTTNTIVGEIVTNPINDKGGAINPNTKQYWKWMGVKITDDVYKEIQDNQRNFFTRDRWKNIPTLYIREDVIKL